MKNRSSRSVGFTLLEMLVAMSVLSVLMLIIFNVISLTAKAWKKSSDHIEAFQGARSGFELMTRTIEQATLNPYLDYYDNAGKRRTASTAGNFTPAGYGRASELEFTCGKNILKAPAPKQTTHAIFFQAPLGSGQANGLDQVLNDCGYFITYGDDSAERPDFITNSVAPVHFRYRLMQWLQPAPVQNIYKKGQGTPWLSSIANTAAEIRPIVQNVVALVIRPRQSSVVEAILPPAERFSVSYDYDSFSSSYANWDGVQPQPAGMHQLPPMIEVTMVIVDETSAIRLFQSATTDDDAAAALGLDYSKLFQDPASYDADLQQVESTLSDRRILFRVFRSTILLRKAQWTS